MVLNGHEILVLLGVALGGGLGVSLVSQFLKRVAGLQSAAAIHTMVIGLTSVAAFAQYVTELHSTLPPTVLGISATTIYGFSQLIYKYASYASKFMRDVKAYNEGQAAKKVSDVAVEAITVPVEITQNTNTVADF
jgi:hypothetical protein